MSEFENKVKHFFKCADKDGNGHLDRMELCKVLSKAGDNRSVDEICRWFDEIDTNRDDKMTVEELLKAMGLRDPKSIQETELRATFRKFDKDNSGKITAEELKSVLTSQGLKGDAAKYIEKYDTDKDGTIHYEEFLKCWKDGL